MRKINAMEWTYACLTSWSEEILYRHPVMTGFLIGLVVGATVL